MLSEKIKLMSCRIAKILPPRQILINTSSVVVLSDEQGTLRAHVTLD
jgi:hypothetical protein